MSDQNNKQLLIEEYRVNSTDTGSAEVQIALFTKRIEEISQHLQNNNAKDYSSLRGLKKLTAKRKKLMNYLKQKNLVAYKALIQSLGIRG